MLCDSKGFCYITTVLTDTQNTYNKITYLVRSIENVTKLFVIIIELAIYLCTGRHNLRNL